MKKREFIKTAFLGSAALATLNTGASGSTKKRSKIKHWVWEHPRKSGATQLLEKKYAAYYSAGIRGIFFETDSEDHFRAAKNVGLETHRWIWTLNRGEKEILQNHPEWYAVNRKGESCATNPPYVNYYRWLCPSKPETQNYLKKVANEVLEKDYVDGIHLDYVRYCDVILPVNLWDKYGIQQNRELPEYDYCYCETCVEGYKNQYGTDILKVKNPDQSPSWRKYRYQQVNAIVNKIAEIAHSHKKMITAAVFPTPEVARRIVRQDWTNWNIDAVCPMIYHGFYSEPVKWIGDAVAEGVHFLNNRFPVYAGLFLPDFKSENELESGITYAMKNGAAGVSLFGKVDEDVLRILKKVTHSIH